MCKYRAGRIVLHLLCILQVLSSLHVHQVRWHVEGIKREL